MNFSDAMSAIRASDSDSVLIPEKWGQGRATFGGILAAALYERLAARVSADRQVRSVMLSFVAPIAPGQLDIQVSVLREGKAATQLQATALQNEQTCVVLLASFGGDRASSVNIRPELGPDMTPPDHLPAFPFVPGLTPDFTQYFDYRYALGKMPFMGSDQTEMGGWIKFREPMSGSVSVAQLLALLDAWPPAVFSRLKKPAAGISLTWMISFEALAEGCHADDWWQYQASIKSSAMGYSHIDATLWDKHGRVAISSRQTVCVFE